ncbi:MAG TPA: hypothetical protein VMU85_14990, partial [Stellaceae bacterium]|nr:hypothetical protein [Stellaceae bacterium]
MGSVGSSGLTAGRGARLVATILLIVLAALRPAVAQQQSAAPAAGFAAPPRSIADIAAVLDSDKPDPAKLARYATLADAQPPAG